MPPELRDRLARRLGTPPASTIVPRPLIVSRPLPMVFLVAFLAGFLLVAPGPLGPGSEAAAGPLRQVVDGNRSEPSQVAFLSDDQELFLEARPLEGEGLLAFARRLTGGEGAVEAIAAANDGARSLVAGVRYRVPFDVLRPELQLRVVQSLFRGDRLEPEGWVHRVQAVDELGRGSLWHVAEWFTGDGASFAAIRQANGLVEDSLEEGAELIIPTELLRPALRRAPVVEVAATPAGEGREPTIGAPREHGAPRESGDAEPAARSGSAGPPAVPAVSTAGERYDLEYGRDAGGDYAVYRLRPGEALYSSVVVRFTGRVVAVDVNALARDIAERSGIRDVTDIPVGYAVKIPFDLLLPEFLPAGHPRRLEWEEGLRESRRFTNRVRTADLEGITVILDAGHGGISVGATMDGVWESVYVYDITLRVRRLLEAHTAATVVTTTRDGPDFDILDRDVLPYSKGHVVLTDPPYPIENSAVGVNLRWYLANSVFRRTVNRGGDPRKLVFVSIHADSLHPSLRGAMVYIPGASLRRGTGFKRGSVYQARAEYREQPSVSFSWTNRVESEGLSRQLAEHLVEALGRRELQVHPFKPVREKIIRQRSAFVPAVLRYNEVPAKMLVEVCNMANPEDRRLLQTRVFRQRTAEAIVDSILAYYGQGSLDDEGVRVARTR